MAILTFGDHDDEVERYLGLPAGISDEADEYRKLPLIIRGVEDWMKAETGRNFEETTYTNQVFDIVDGQRMLPLSDWPVTAFSNLQEILLRGADGTITWDTALVQDYDFVVDTEAGMVFSLRDTFKPGRQSVRATYTAGYTTTQLADVTDPVPDEIQTWKLLELSIIAREWGLAKDNKRHLSSVSFAEEADTFQLQLDPMQRRMLNSLCRAKHTLR